MPKLARGPGPRPAGRVGAIHTYNWRSLRLAPVAAKRQRYVTPRESERVASQAEAARARTASRAKAKLCISPFCVRYNIAAGLISPALLHLSDTMRQICSRRPRALIFALLVAQTLGMVTTVPPTGDECFWSGEVGTGEHVSGSFEVLRCVHMIFATRLLRSALARARVSFSFRAAAAAAPSLAPTLAGRPSLPQRRNARRGRDAV